MLCFGCLPEAAEGGGERLLRKYRSFAAGCTHGQFQLKTWTGMHHQRYWLRRSSGDVLSSTSSTWNRIWNLGTSVICGCRRCRAFQTLLNPRPLHSSWHPTLISAGIKSIFVLVQTERGEETTLNARTPESTTPNPRPQTVQQPSQGPQIPCQGLGFRV